MVEKRQVACIALGIGAAVLAFYVDNAASPIADGYVLERNAYGQGEREQALLVEGLLEAEAEVGIQIGERQYEEAAARQAMEEAEGKLAGLILGENPSLNEVNSQLNLITWLEESGISVDWVPEDPELIGTDGEVYGKQCPETGTQTTLTARLTAGDYSHTCIFPVTVYPPFQTKEEIRLEQFSDLLQQMDKSQQISNQFILPEEYEGKILRYRVKRDNSFLLFPFLGFFAAFLLPFLDKQKEQERVRARERQMMLDYPGIVSKLVVFTGAGLPVRKAWERIVWDYEHKDGGKREAYEEMAGVYYMMQRGVPELKAYAEFGNRCRLLPYRKLAGLLEQNIRKGSEGLRLVLEAELEDAFEQQKTLARRMGEEASTRLLLPLFLLLSIVMVMVSVPAFLSFGL